MDKKTKALVEAWWQKHRFDAGKHAQLTAAFDAAERALEAAALDDVDAMLAAHSQAATLLTTYEERVRHLRTEFAQLEQEHRVVDPCVCAENASGVKQDGHDENDIEYWQVMVNCAREQIDDAVEALKAKGRVRKPRSDCGFGL